MKRGRTLVRSMSMSNEYVMKKSNTYVQKGEEDRMREEAKG
jgi:hypothetical protein